MYVSTHRGISSHDRWGRSSFSGWRWFGSGVSGEAFQTDRSVQARDGRCRAWHHVVRFDHDPENPMEHDTTEEGVYMDVYRVVEQIRVKDDFSDSRSVVANRFLNDRDLFLTKPVQFVDDLVDQRVRLLDLGVELLGALFRPQVVLQVVGHVVDIG